jgi:hypothetical protein
MAHIIEDFTVPLPATTVFAYVADFTNTRHWDPQIDEARRLDTGPIGVGSAFEVALRIGSRTTKLVYTVMVFVPDERIVLETSGSWYRGRDDVHIRPSAAGGSAVRWDAVFALRGPFVILEPLLRIGFRRTAKKAVAGLEAALNALHVEEG